jgi:hypothetical protein
MSGDAKIKMRNVDPTPLHSARSVFADKRVLQELAKIGQIVINFHKISY